MITHNRHITASCILALIASLTAGNAWGESVTYRITEYNTSTASFLLTACGERPVGSYATFENDFGATYGNRYNQIPRNREATLWLTGWEGCCINGITLSMCSNKSSGTAGLVVSMDNEVRYEMKAEEFCSEAWFGCWVNKDLGIYVDVTKPMPEPIAVTEDAEVGITVKGGTPEGSVYLHAITIDYTPGPDIATEAPLGWVYEKIEAKGKLNDGDVVMIYRNGSAAGDIDGMEQQHYLDAIALSSTAAIDDPFVTLFTANTTSDGHWTLTNQYGERLGAKGAQHLAWDAGTETWDIKLGYDGATIASTNTKYGTLRYNAPAESYARFWNYTSKSLPLPFLYRQARQQSPVVSTAIELSATEREVLLSEQDTLVIQHRITPKTTTDQRIAWSSSDETVATVRDGIVFVVGPGECIIKASSYDGGSVATCHVKINGNLTAIRPITPGTSDAPTPTYDLSGHLWRPTLPSIVVRNGRKRWVKNK